ncbi:metallophosphoesterase family protein [Dethiobacter alkaliphilus]|uniref:Nuclease SbcCD subunit D n=1 Tax=Dethiobacter alkaliphilus AHT 1 TaxID=555088 RepID=C0GD02_DETAL|nr:exonuclease SbcCD subunit D [Dethiobacter alkaliphilus]EEG79087.1 metallophosphoesterase [Dethiobacter alkaliphilus AHT 1]
MTISMIHCGDIHLGFDQYNSEERFHDFHRSFLNIVDYAIENRVDYFVIAGDFFNKRSINPRTLSQAIDGLNRLRKKEIRVIAIEGNHDKAPYGQGDSWMDFLNQQEYFYLLNPRFDQGDLVLEAYEQKQGGSLVAFPGIRFVGLGYQGSMTARRLSELNEQLEKSEEVTILLLHSAVNNLLHLGGIKYEDIALLKEKIDYVAMGHIHQRYELDHWIYNPGSPECWDVGEGAKEKGFYHVVFADGQKNVTFVPSLKRPVHSLAVNVSGCEELDEVYALCDEEVDKLDIKEDSRPIVQLIIKGYTPFNPLAIDTKLLEEKIANTLDCLIVEVVNNAVMKGSHHATSDGPEMNRDDLEREVLRGLFMEKGNLSPWVDELVDLSRNVKELILKEADEQSVSALVESLAEKIVAEDLVQDCEEQVAAAMESNDEGSEA